MRILFWSSLLLISFISYYIGIYNEKNRKMLSERNLTALDFYFGQVNVWLWPRFEKLFDMNL